MGGEAEDERDREGPGHGYGYGFRPRLLFQDQVQEYFCSVFGPQHFNNISQALTSVLCSVLLLFFFFASSPFLLENLNSAMA